MKRCLIVLAKEPKKGRVKTRLQGYLSKTQCVNLYKAFLRDTLELVNKVSCEYKILAYESYGKTPRYLNRIASRCIFYKQEGNGLGERMYNACKFAKDNGASKTVVIGSDSPDLPLSAIKEAFVLLSHADVVLGPSFDGGYYLIGMKRPDFELFKGISWSSRTVFKDTIRNAGKLKNSVALLEKRYDVDDVAGLLRINKDLNKPRNRGIASRTRKFLSAVRWKKVNKKMKQLLV